MKNFQEPKNKLDKEMAEELRKQGINPDFIDDFGDTYEDYADEYGGSDYQNDNYDEYGDDSYAY